jgi:hypothetical protein
MPSADRVTVQGNPEEGEQDESWGLVPSRGDDRARAASSGRRTRSDTEGAHRLRPHRVELRGAVATVAWHSVCVRSSQCADRPVAQLDPFSVQASERVSNRLAAGLRPSLRDHLRSDRFAATGPRQRGADPNRGSLRSLFGRDLARREQHRRVALFRPVARSRPARGRTRRSPVGRRPF